MNRITIICDSIRRPFYCDKAVLLFLAFICLLLSYYSAYSQTQPATLTKDTTGENLALQVKQLDEFLNRLNTSTVVVPVGEVGNASQELTPDQGKEIKLDRYKSILMLFNSQDSTFKRNVVFDFSNDLTGYLEKQKMNFTDIGFFATVKCVFMYHKKRVSVQIALKTEGSSKEGFRWVIAAVKNNGLREQLNNRDKAKFISPMNHELGFMALGDIFKENTGVLSYTSSNFEPDPLTQFITLVQNGNLEFISSDGLTFHFLQVPSWIFTVDYFNRNTNNSGWLISSLLKTENSEKSNYLSSKIGVKTSLVNDSK